ncbi:MAG: HAD-IIIA family hydrolase [Candidatus Omnitrophota bacterium]
MIEDRARKIKLLVLDVDGVLTDGRIIYDNFGNEIKCFNVLDGFGIKLLKDAGIKPAIITAKKTKIVKRRAKDLGIEHVYYGFDKLSLYQSLIKRLNIKDEEVCFMGDDLFDLAVLKKVGFSACPPNAVEEVKETVHYITEKEGGKGAVRELIEVILKSRDEWGSVVSSYSI